jgi:glycosyltransferase involved in cell wall biosynthesis
MSSNNRRVIAHIITRLLNGGAEENTLHTCKSQVDAGHTVLLIHGRDFDPDLVARARAVCEVIEAPSLVHPLSLRDDARAVRDLRMLFKARGVDVVHTHQSKAGIVGRIAARLAGVKLIVHGVHILPWISVGPVKAAVYLTAERICALFTDAFVSVSPSVRDACLEKGIGEPARHFVAFSAMDVDKFKAAKPPPDSHELLGLDPAKDRPPVALMLAAFEPRKRQADVVRALPEAFRSIPDWRVVFAGEGPEHEATRDLVRELNLEEFVRFTGYRGDPERLIAMADVCFLTSEREGLPRVVVQYAAGGKAMVLSDLPGLQDVLTADDAAVITPANDVSAAMQQVAKLLCEPERRDRIAQQAKTISVDRWSPASMAQSIDAAYEAGWWRRSALAGRSS